VIELTLERLLLAVAINLAFGALAWWRGAVSRSGFIGGVIVGTLLFWFGGAGAFAALASFFVVGTAATRLGYRRKAAQGLAQEEGGRRGTRHALANCGTGLGLALTMPFWTSIAPAVGLVAAFATAASDTLGSEIGQLYGRRPFLPTTFRRVPAGTEGAVSVEGTLAGIVGSIALAAVGWVSGLYGAVWMSAIVVGAFAGTTVESYVGAIWGREAKVGNETMNFLNTLVGAAVAMAIVLVVRGW
jgi:uncharacterized protein (TIGR00297 family)